MGLKHFASLAFSSCSEESYCLVHMLPRRGVKPMKWKMIFLYICSYILFGGFCGFICTKHQFRCRGNSNNLAKQSVKVEALADYWFYGVEINPRSCRRSSFQQLNGRRQHEFCFRFRQQLPDDHAKIVWRFRVLVRVFRLYRRTMHPIFQQCRL